MQYYVIQVLTSGEDDYIDHATRLRPSLHFILPKRTLAIRKEGKTVNTISCVFPGYVFLEIQELELGGDDYFSLRRTPGFFRFLPDNSKPAELGESDRQLIFHFSRFAASETISKVTFDDNDRIVVLEGPLKGMEGKIVSVDRRKRRAKIKLDLYDTSFPIDLGFEVVEKTRSSAASSDPVDRQGSRIRPDNHAGIMENSQGFGSNP